MGVFGSLAITILALLSECCYFGRLENLAIEGNLAYNINKWLAWLSSQASSCMEDHGLPVLHLGANK